MSEDEFGDLEILEIIKKALLENENIEEAEDYSEVAYEGIAVKTTSGERYTIMIMAEGSEEDEEEEDEEEEDEEEEDEEEGKATTCGTITK